MLAKAGAGRGVSKLFAYAIFGFLAVRFVYVLILFLRRASLRRYLRKKYPGGFSARGAVYYSEGLDNTEPELEAPDRDVFVRSRARPCGKYDSKGVYQAITYDWRVGNTASFPEYYP